MTESPWLSVQEAASLAKVSRRTMYNWLPKIAPEDQRRTVSGLLRIRQWSWLDGGSPEQTCRTCAWWIPVTESTWGLCHQPRDLILARGQDIETRQNFSCQTWKAS